MAGWRRASCSGRAASCRWRSPAFSHGDAVIAELERQLRNPNPGRMDGRFAFRTGVPERLAAGLSAAEAKLYATIGAAPLPLDRLLASTAQNATLARLVARGLVHVAGFTPSDAAHVLGRQANWNEAAARLGAELFARKRDGRGQPIAPTPEAISERVLDGADPLFGRSHPRDRLRRGRARRRRHRRACAGAARRRRACDGIARLSVALDRPVIGLGASAPLHYAGLPPLVGNRCVVPEHTDVANALGAVVGQVRVIGRGAGQPAQGRPVPRERPATRCAISPTRRRPSPPPRPRPRHRRRARAGRRHRYGRDRGRARRPDRHRRGPAQLHRGAHRRGGGRAAEDCGVSRLAISPFDGRGSPMPIGASAAFSSDSSPLDRRASAQRCLAPASPAGMLDREGEPASLHHR